MSPQYPRIFLRLLLTGIAYYLGVACGNIAIMIREGSPLSFVPGNTSTLVMEIYFGFLLGSTFLRNVLLLIFAVAFAYIFTKRLPVWTVFILALCFGYLEIATGDSICVGVARRWVPY